MMNDLPPLPPRVTELIARERLALVTTDEQRGAVARRLAVTLGLGTTIAATKATAATSSASTVVAAKIAIVAVAIGAVGSGWWWTRQREAPRVAVTRAVEPPHTPERHAPPPAVVAPTGSATMVTDPELPVRRHRSPAPPRVVPDEPALLARAITAIGHGTPELALELLDEDARDHPNGPLREERIAMQISALAAAGRTADACTLARDFQREYPDSIHRSATARLDCE